MGKTTIEWTDDSWNPVTGCQAISEGCANCYAAQLAATRLFDTHRYRGLAHQNESGRGVWTGNVQLHFDRLCEPYRKQRGRRIFVCDMSDLFYEAVPESFVDRVFAVMLCSPQHTFQVLTKRPARMRDYLRTVEEEKGLQRWLNAAEELGFVAPPDESLGWPLRNVWLGTSIENQPTAQTRLPALAHCPAVGRFLSMEPLLEDVILEPTLMREIALAILGGESTQGGHARDCNLYWLRSAMRQCRATQTLVFVKQVGSRPTISYREGIYVKEQLLQVRHKKGADMEEWPEDLRVRELPKAWQ